jgi:hypothetical protein
MIRNARLARALSFSTPNRHPREGVVFREIGRMESV